MDLTFNILLFLHFVALIVGATANVAMPLIMPQMMKAPPEARAGYASIGKTLSLYGRGAVALLIVTGVAMVWLRYGGVAGMNEWFWAKMALVALIVVLMAVTAVVGPGRINPRIFGMVARVLLLGIVLTAVFAFS